MGRLFLVIAILVVAASNMGAANTNGVLSHIPESRENEIHEYAALYSSFPPPLSSEDHEALDEGLKADSCGCTQVLVSSLGGAQTYQHDSLGVYKYYQLYNNHPSYFGPGNRRLYFLFNSGWLLGPTLGNPSGYIHNSNQYQCPYLVPNGWMYVNSGYWYTDDSLVVRCIA